MLQKKKLNQQNKCRICGEEIEKGKEAYYQGIKLCQDCWEILKHRVLRIKI